VYSTYLGELTGFQKEGGEIVNKTYSHQSQAQNQAETKNQKDQPWGEFDFHGGSIFEARDELSAAADQVTADRHSGGCEIK
jgi:hypothetical protein